MATRTLRVTLADILGPAGPAGRVHGEVWAVFVDGNGSPRQIRYTDGTVVVPAAPRQSLNSAGVVDFSIVPNDDATIHVDDRGFGVKVGWDLTVRGERGAKVPVKNAGTIVQVATSDPAPPLFVQFGLKAPYVPIIPGSAYLTQGAADALYAPAGTGAATADQVDFVELTRSVSRRYTSMKFAKVAADKYQVRLHDGEKGATYQFVKDTLDDFIKIDACYTGFGYSATVSANIVVPTNTTGTWNTATASYYTTTVGGTYTQTLAAGASKIELRIIQESRGGLWSVQVKNGATVVATTPVSCYAATTSAAFLVTLATGLDPAVSYTVVATYQGDDPANAPSSGPSRGYVRSDAVSGSIVGSVSGASTTDMVLADGSNKEMAFSCVLPAGGGVNWVPEHDGIASAIKIDNPGFYLSGVLVDPTGWTVGQSQDITSFRLQQHFYGKVAATNALEFRTVHAIDAVGMLTFDGRFKCLTAGLQVTGYPLMLPAGGGTNEFVSGIGNSKVNVGDESYSYFTAEKDNVYSGAVVSSTNRNLVGAVRLKNPRLAYRRGKTGKPTPGQDLFVWMRASKPKMYWEPFVSTTFAVNDAYAWSFDLMVADADNVYTMVKS